MKNSKRILRALRIDAAVLSLCFLLMPAIAFAALKNFVSKPAIFSTALSSARLNSGGNTTSFIFVYQ